ncbi:hypothetical protein HK102_012793, partial [Quaeritorhiza haematococci]
MITAASRSNAAPSPAPTSTTTPIPTGKSSTDASIPDIDAFAPHLLRLMRQCRDATTKTGGRYLVGIPISLPSPPDNESQAVDFQQRSTKSTTSATPTPSATMWFFPPQVRHPLRDAVVGEREPFFLVTGRSTRGTSATGTGEGENITIKLNAATVINVGSAAQREAPYSKPMGEGDESCSGKEEYHVPLNAHTTSALDIDVARYILSSFSLAHTSLLPNLATSGEEEGTIAMSGTLFAYCSTADSHVKSSTNRSSAGKKCYLGVEAASSNGQHQKLIGQGRKREKTALMVHDIQEKGFFTADTEDEEGNMPTMDDLLDIYDECAPNDVEFPNPSITSRYEILSEHAFKMGGNAPASFILMEVSWQGAYKVLGNPPSSANIELRICNVHGQLDPYNHTPTYNLRTELETLIDWNAIQNEGASQKDGKKGTTDGATVDGNGPAKGVRRRRRKGRAHGVDESGRLRFDGWDAGEMRDGQVEGEGGEENGNGEEGMMKEEVEPLDIRIERFLQEIENEGGSIRVEDDRGMAQMDSLDLDSLNALPGRQDLDFTERLWMFVQDVDTEEDLKQVIKAVIRRLENGTLQPLINKSNRCALANVIRDLLTTSHTHMTPSELASSCESIAGSFGHWTENVLECMVEVGIEKMRRDYCHYIVGNELASWNQLEYYLDDTLPLDDQILRLRCLHRVLELWSLIKSNIIAVPYEVMREIVQTALRFYMGIVEKGVGDQSGEKGRSGEGEDDVGGEGPESAVVFRMVLPRFSGGIGKMLSGLASSFKPHFWSTTWKHRYTPPTNEDSSETFNGGGVVVRSAAAGGATKPGFAMSIQFDRSDALFKTKNLESIV